MTTDISPDLANRQAEEIPERLTRGEKRWGRGRGALVNPPGNPKSRYQTTADGQDNPPDPQEWLNTAKTEHESWWPDYAGWLADRSEPERAAPDTLGGTRFAVLAAAPGNYATHR